MRTRTRATNLPTKCSFRCTPDEREQFERLAERNGLTLSEYARSVMTHAAEQEHRLLLHNIISEEVIGGRLLAAQDGKDLADQNLLSEIETGAILKAEALASRRKMLVGTLLNGKVA